MNVPEFLELPPRSRKPRASGLTHVLDKSMHLDDLVGFIDSAGDFIDMWKFGWGTGYIDPMLAKKAAALSGHGIRACLGGTLLEVAWSQGKEDQYLAWAADQELQCVEVSNGALDLPVPEKRRLIAKASKDFLVLSEVGSKDPSVPVSPAQWADQAAGDVDAGASWVLGEGRESGSVGLYTPEGEVREEVVEAMVAAVGADRMIFEAPRRSQQAWFVRRFGPDVNLGNVVPAEVLGLETLRLGLRADTIGAYGR
ncbi:MAG TPA: phosphosulfolactate synthase [Actinomycetota bacterium]|nr:phosphosulfolactate synthase [Actinomycetota bacterium]